MTPQEYEAKRQARITRLEERAARLRQQGAASMESGRKMLSVIPFGQPILVGHYSEGRDRRYRARAGARMDKGAAMLSEAAKVEQRAKAAEDNRAIFTDDPAAGDKLGARIAQLESRQRLMTAANRCVRRLDRSGLADLGFSEKRIDQLFTPDFCGRLGFPDYALTNNSANIRRLKGRLGQVEAARDRETTETTTTTHAGEVRMVENADDNRLQLYFPGKPSHEIRARLKACGFRWSPTAGAWQRHLSNGAKVAAQWAIGAPVVTPAPAVTAITGPEGEGEPC